MKYKEFKQASNRVDSPANNLTHYFSHYFAVPVAFLCHRFGLTPNQVTGLFLGVGCLSGVALYFQQGILAYILWRLHLILDMADGSLARATRTFSANAVGFDRSNHIVINTTVLLGTVATTGNIILANILMASFFLHYFFNRNYVKDKVSTQYLSLPISFIRHLLGIEGFIAIGAVLLSFGMLDYIHLLALSYSITFALLFFVKLHRHLKS